MSESLYWTWLSLRLGDASPYLNSLVSAFSSPKELYEASFSEIMAIEKLPESVKLRLTDKDLGRAQSIIDDCKKLGIGIMTYADSRYPRILKYISNPPAVLYFKGQLVDFDKKFCVAMVGTREMSDYGRDMAYKFAYELASAGAVVISGMALGVDGMAAAGALDAHAPTVAVLGNGVESAYPKVHKKLYSNILKEGMIISEYPPGSSPDGHHFPKRNRIISGLARCTLVVECPDPSGALITADKASAQGRPVFAIPGSLNMEKSKGTNKLIKEGARMVTCVEDIIDAFESVAFQDLDVSAIGYAEYDSKKAANRYGVESKKDERKIIRINRNKNKDSEETEPADAIGFEKELKDSPKEFQILSPAEKQVYDYIPDDGEVGLDFLVSASGQSVSDIMMHLLSLSVKKAILQMPGNRYRRS